LGHTTEVTFVPLFQKKDIMSASNVCCGRLVRAMPN
jgi:hypothetical protein